MKLLIAIFIAAIVAFSAPATADSQDGWDAYKRGDSATALKEWRPLAEQGDASAQFYLGFMYSDGLGVLQDNRRTHMWLNIAASNGHEDAAENREIIAKRMAPADVSTRRAVAQLRRRRRMRVG